MKQVGLYVRVSTTRQEADNQLIQLRSFSKKRGYEIYWEYVDVISGAKDSRPQFNRLFEDAHKGLIDVVLFWDLSRFSRGGTLFTLQKLQELKNINVDWVSYQEKYINSVGEFSDVIISLLATIAKIERQKISERTKAGLERLKREGKVLGRPKGSNDKKKRNRSCWKKD